MKSENTYKNCIHDIGLDPFYVHFYVPETLHLYRAYCKTTPHPSIIVDATGSIIKRFSKLGLEKTRTLLLYDAVVYDDIRKHSFTVCSMISEGHDNTIIYNWLSRWLKNDVPSPKETCCDMSIALLSALVRSFTQYTALNDYIGVCAQLILGTISRDSNLLPRCYIHVDVAHFIKNLTKWSCFTTAQRRVKEVYLRAICHIIKSQSFTEIRSILLSIFIVASNETDQMNSLTGRPTPCQTHKDKLLEAASSGFVHLEDDFNNLLNNSTSEDVPNMPNISESDLNYTGLEEQNSQFTAWVENIYEESKNYLEDGTGLNPLVLPSIIPFLIKSIKMLPLWSGIMIPIFRYGTPTKSSAAVESMFHKTKNIVFKDINLPTTLETFLERRVVSLKGSALLNNYEELSEENEGHSSSLISNISQFNVIYDDENNIPLLSCGRNEKQLTQINCPDPNSSNKIHAIRITSKVKCPLCSSGRIPETSGMHKCNTCGIPVHAIEGCSYYYDDEDTVRVCSDCFKGSMNTNHSNSFSANNTLSKIVDSTTEDYIDNVEQSRLNLNTEQNFNNTNKSQNQINKIDMNDDIINENIATENWNRQKKKSTKSYLLPNPHLKYIDMTARQTKSLPMLKNGSRADDLKALSLKKYGSVVLSNTCAFDTAVFLLMVAFCDSEKYFNSLSSTHEDYKFIEFIKKTLSKGVTVNTYRQRARIIIETQKPTSTPLKYGQNLIKCDTTFGNLLKCMLPKCPTVIDRSSCSNDQCNKTQYAYAYLTYIFYENFDTLQDYINTRVNQSKNKCKNKLCNGTVTLTPELSKDHIFVETFKFSEGNYNNNKKNRQINF